MIMNINKKEKPRVILASVSSDSHTWNLVYLELLMQEIGVDVINLGCCVPDQEIIQNIIMQKPFLVVISSVNGHGYNEGSRLIRNIHEEVEEQCPPIVIGGKLGIQGNKNISLSNDLIKRGFSRVFDESQAISDFENYLTNLIHLESIDNKISLAG
jgi:methylaspartate mutase sigma subunit|tara:strand:+ start:51375 stop:51842 length:468 start_codon:yes stop_codon:yes gene_type:complete